MSPATSAWDIAAGSTQSKPTDRGPGATNGSPQCRAFRIRPIDLRCCVEATCGILFSQSLHWLLQVFCLRTSCLSYFLPQCVSFFQLLPICSQAYYHYFFLYLLFQFRKPAQRCELSFTCAQLISSCMLSSQLHHLMSCWKKPTLP